MSDISLRSIRAVIAVCEEASFTRAADREHATQSGISQHIAAAERALGVRLFERKGGRVVPTPAGQRYYRQCVAAISALDQAAEQARPQAIAGPLRVGLMPSFTRAVVAPVMEAFVPHHPDVQLHIIEGYSHLLTEMVRDGDLDFAVVPAFEGMTGVTARLLTHDREMLLSGPQRGLTPLSPVRLRDLAPLKIVVPGANNTRRRILETYFQTHAIDIAARLEIDAMIATLEFVARTDWIAILPSVISINDIDRGELIVNPLTGPPLHADYVVIRPARRALSPTARPFLAGLEAEVARIHQRWAKALRQPAGGAVKPRRRGRASGPPP